MSGYKYDYAAMELDFTTSPTEKSVRAVALAHGVPPASVSVVQTYARKHEWDQKREQQQGRSSEKAVEVLATKSAAQAVRRAEVQDNALELIDEAINSTRKALQMTHHVKEHDGDGAEIWVERPKYPVSVPAVTQLLDRLERVVGVSMGPSPEGNGGSGFNIDPAQLGAGGIDILAVIARAARGRSGGAEPIRVGSGPGRDPEGAGED